MAMMARGHRRDPARSCVLLKFELVRSIGSTQLSEALAQLANEHLGLKRGEVTALTDRPSIGGRRNL